MKKKLLKLFLAYSYVTAVCYIGSENSLNIAKAKYSKGDSKDKIRMESLWKTTLKRWKETEKIIFDFYGDLGA